MASSNPSGAWNNPTSVSRPTVEGFSCPESRDFYCRLLKSILQSDTENMQNIFEEIRDLDEKINYAKSLLENGFISMSENDEFSFAMPDIPLHPVEGEILCKAHTFPESFLVMETDPEILTRLLNAMERLLRLQVVWLEVEKQRTLLDKVRVATKNYKATLLHYAAGHGDPAMAQALCPVAAGRSIKDSNGRMPIEAALFNPINIPMQQTLKL